MTDHTGTDGDNRLEGGRGAATLNGSRGNDRLYGHEGADTLNGGADNDILEGDSGADTLACGAGVDTASFADSAEAVRVTLDNTPVTNGDEFQVNTHTNSGGDAEGDVLRNIENLIGSDHDDHLTSDGGDNRLDGGFGADTLTGDAGADTFVFASFEGDRITDFEDGEDRIGIAGGTFDDLSFSDDADGSGVTVTWDGGSLSISGVQSTDLTVDDFVFL